jgi:aminotransferase
MKIAKRVSDIQNSPIKDIWLFAEKMGWKSSLGEGSPFFETPSHIINSVTKEIGAHWVARYCPTPGLLQLRERLCQKLSEINHIESTPDQILVTSGANEGVGIALMTIVEPGDEVILTSPAYCSHIEQVLLAGGTPKFVNLVENEGWGFKIEELKKSVTPRTKCLLFCSPLNPTGSVLSTKDLESIAELALSHNIYIITDEAYEYFVYDNALHFSIASLPEVRNLVISCFSFSKTYSLAGWRIGYNWSSEIIGKEMLKIHEDLAICAPIISQVAALAALNGPQNCIDIFKSSLLKRRDLVINCINKARSISVQYIPMGAYYVLAKINIPNYRKNSYGFCRRLVSEAGLVAIPGNGFGPTAEGHIRISFSSEETNISHFFTLLEEWERSM